MNEIEFYNPIFQEFLTKFEKELEGTNYGVEFGFIAGDIEGSCTDPKDVLLELVPDQVSSVTKVSKVSGRHFLAEIKSKILMKDFDGMYPDHYNTKLIQKIRNERLPKLESHIRNFLTLNNANCYKTDGLPGMPFLDIIWSFCYLLIEPERKRALIIHGGASD